MTDGFRVTHLDELEPQEGDEGSRWFRLRRELDVGAFGINAYGADAGKRVIEEHDELGLSAAKHEELYVVLRGAARFTLDGEEASVPAGSCVFVRDTAVRRGAIAEQDGTIVLVVGGTPGKANEVAPWELAADAFPHWRAGDYAKAAEILRGVAEAHPDAGIVLYNLACVEALSGHPDASIEYLGRAVAAEERFRDFARTDDDFASVRDRPEFARLLEEVQ